MSGLERRCGVKGKKASPGSLNKGLRRTISLILLIGLLIYDLKYWKGNWHEAVILLTNDNWQVRVVAAVSLLAVVSLFSAAMVLHKRSIWVAVLVAFVAFACIGWDELSKFEGAGTLSAALLTGIAYIVLVWTSLRSNTLTPAWVFDRWKWWDDLTDKNGFRILR